MIRQPRPGQRVRLHYAVARQHFFARWQDCTGVVEFVAGFSSAKVDGRRVRTPRNVQVLLDDGRRTVCPRGNLYAVGERAT